MLFLVALLSPVVLAQRMSDSINITANNMQTTASITSGTASLKSFDTFHMTPSTDGNIIQLGNGTTISKNLASQAAFAFSAPTFSGGGNRTFTLGVKTHWNLRTDSAESYQIAYRKQDGLGIQPWVTRNGAGMINGNYSLQAASGDAFSIFFIVATSSNSGTRTSVVVDNFFVYGF